MMIRRALAALALSAALLPVSGSLRHETAWAGTGQTSYCDSGDGWLFQTSILGYFGYSGSQATYAPPGPYADSLCQTGTELAIQGPGQYGSGTSTITYWYNAKFYDAWNQKYFCLYPRAYGTASGGTGQYDGDAHQGACSF